MTNTYDKMLEEFEEFWSKEFGCPACDYSECEARYSMVLKSFLLHSHLQILQQQREEIEGMEKNRKYALGYDKALSDLLSLKDQEIQSVKELLTNQ